MGKKTVVIILGLILVIAGIVAMVYTEPAGDEGSGPSGGISSWSEDVQPYFWYGVVLVVLGIIVLAAALMKLP